MGLSIQLNPQPHNVHYEVEDSVCQHSLRGKVAFRRMVRVTRYQISRLSVAFSYQRCYINKWRMSR